MRHHVHGHLQSATTRRRWLWRVLIVIFVVLCVVSWTQPNRISSGLGSAKENTEASNKGDESAVGGNGVQLSEGAILIAMTSIADQLPGKLATIRGSGFTGSIVVLCHADRSACSRMKESTSSHEHATVRMIQGTTAIRRSGQLLLSASYATLLTGMPEPIQHSHDNPIIMLADIDEARWCRNPLFNTDINHHDFFALGDSFWSQRTFLDLRQWSAIKKYNKPSSDDTVDKNIVYAGSFFVGSRKVVQTVLQAVNQTFSRSLVAAHIPIAVLLSDRSTALRSAVEAALSPHSIVKLSRGEVLSPEDCVKVGGRDSCANPAVDIVTERIRCQQPPREDDGVRRLSWKCSSRFGDRSVLGVRAPGSAAPDSLLPATVATNVKDAWINMIGTYETAKSSSRSHHNPKYARCPGNRQNLMMAFTGTLDPASLLPMITQFHNLPRSDGVCTRLTLLVRDKDIWEARIKPDWAVDLISIRPYEIEARCLSSGPYVCRHEVMHRALRELKQSFADRLGLVLILDLLSGIPTIHSDPFSDAFDAHEEEIHEIFPGQPPQDFVAVVASPEAAGVVDWSSPQTFLKHDAAMRRRFGEEFTSRSYERSLQSLGLSSSSELIPQLTNSILGTPLAVMQLLKLLHITLAVTQGPSNPTVGPVTVVDDSAVLYALATTGLTLSHFPFPFYIMNPNQSPVVLPMERRQEDEREIIVSDGNAYLATCRSRKYAVVQHRRQSS